MESNKNTLSPLLVTFSRSRKRRLFRNLLRGAGTVLDLMPTQEPTRALRGTAGTKGGTSGVEVACTEPRAELEAIRKLYHADLEALASDWSSVGDDITKVLTPLNEALASDSSSVRTGMTMTRLKALSAVLGRVPNPQATEKEKEKERVMVVGGVSGGVHEHHTELTETKQDA